MKGLILTMSLCICAVSIYAQRTISGTVTDDIGPLIGVNILIKNSSQGTTTDLDGNYSIEAEDGDVLVFNYLGYEPKEIEVSGQSTIDVEMSSSALDLQDVVVTALGFKEKRDNMSSTYSKIEADKVVQKGQNKVIDGLAGKASGVRITAASGDPGAGANIQIRGQNTLSGSTQPLIIVDGVPLNNDNLRGSAGGADADAGVSQQSRLNDINPEDIESFQIYKGASAGALYGTRAMNGVIVITTKRGSKGKPRISISTGLTIDQIAFKHPLQSTFGQGVNGNYSPTTAFSWGDKISERSGGDDVVNTSGQFFESLVSDNIIYPIEQKNSREVFHDRNFDRVFRDGSNWDSKVTISGGNDKGTFYISGGYVQQEGIIKNTFYDKTNFTFAGTQNFSPRFSASAKANIILSESNRAQQGSNTAGVYLGLLRNPADFDLADYIGNHVSSTGVVTTQRQRSYRRYLGNNDNAIYNNPLWTINEQRSEAAVQRFIGSAELNYDLGAGFRITARGGADVYDDARLYFFPYYTTGADKRFGLLEDETFQSKEVNFDLLTSWGGNIVDKLSANVIVAFGLNERRRKRNLQTADNFIANFRDLYDPNEISAKQNISAEIGQTNRSNIRFYGTSAFNFADELFLTLGGSLENHSTLSDVFFYPSVELGWNFIERIQNPGPLTFGKLRLAYGQVGNVPLPHRGETFYEVGVFSTFSDGINLEDFGGGYQLDERVGNSALRPEIKTEYEGGVDLRFHRNRISLSGTYYYNKIEDVLLDINIAPSLGFTEIYGNGAEIENRGWELDLGYVFFRNDDWDLGVNLNLNSNINEVTKLAGGGVINLTPGSSLQSVAIEGHAIGSFYTQDAIRDEDGNFILNEHGFPVPSGVFSVVGDPNPEWRGGFGFNGSYKDLSVGVLFETSQGNDFGERTRFITSYFGTHADTENEITLDRDLVNFDGNTIPAGTTVRGNIRDFGAGDVLLDEAYYTNIHGFGDGALNSFAVSDGSWTRLREVTINYIVRNIKALGLESIELGVSGRNLALWTKEVVGQDPDVNQFGVGLGQGLDYFSNPGTKSYAFNVRLNF